MSDDGAEEFNCADCTAAVVRFGAYPNQPKLCAGCQFLTWIDDPEKRASMRAHMIEHGIIGEQA